MALTSKTFFQNFKREVAGDRIGDVAAMMTYYAMFAIFPMLVFVVTLALFVLPDSVIHDAVGMISTAIPNEAGTMLREQVQQMQSAAHGGFAFLGAALALWSASRGAASLSKALNDMYEKEETRPWWKRQLIALGTTLAVAALILIALGLLVAGPTVGHLVADRFGLAATFDTIWSIGRWLGAGLLIMLVWAILYKWLPNTNAPFRFFTVGAIAGVLLWIAMSKGFAIYVANFGKYEKIYGTLAGVIIFLMWLWLSNLALLIGAEVNDVLADLRKDKSSAAKQLAEDKPRPPRGFRPTGQHS
jgi:membrane protein